MPYTLSSSISLSDLPTPDKGKSNKPLFHCGKRWGGGGGHLVFVNFIYYLLCSPYKTPLSFMTLQGHHLEKRTKLTARGHFFRISQLQSWPKTLDKLPTRLKKVLAFPTEFPFHSTR